MLSALAADHVQRPRNVGPLAPPARYGVSGAPGDGPWIEIWLRVEGERIADAAYRTHGCPASIASASMVCDLVRGRTFEQAMCLDVDDLLAVLGGLPEGKGHLADLAVAALKSGIRGQS